MKCNVMVFALLGIASPTVVADAPCTAATLQGQYVFTGRGFIEAVEPGIQRVHYGVFRFDGKGNFSGKQSSSRGGRIGREKLQGTYTLEDDCTGTMSLNSILKPGSQLPQTHWDLYVTTDGRHGNIIRMDDGNMAVRSFEK